jgi:hypothetical protein
MKLLHITQMRQLIEQGKPCELKVWKSTNGDILEYRNAVMIGHDSRRGTFRVMLQTSHQIREFRDVCVFEINGMQVHL